MIKPFERPIFLGNTNRKGVHMKYTRQVETFSAARRALMLPHPDGEAESIVSAFAECDRGIKDVDQGGLDEHAWEWLGKLEALMNTDGLELKFGKALWTLKAERLSEDEKFELSDVVNSLADWFTQADA